MEGKKIQQNGTKRNETIVLKMDSPEACGVSLGEWKRQGSSPSIENG